MREYRQAFVREGKPFTTDASEAREHIILLAQRGIGLRALAQLSGLGYNTCRDVKRGVDRCYVSTAEAILAVACDDRVAGQRIPKDEAVALVERLQAAGVSHEAIAKALGYRTRALSITTTRRKSITVGTYRRLEVLARLLVSRGRVPVSVLGEDS